MESLNNLAECDETQATIAWHTYRGLTTNEIAKLMGVSLATVKRELKKAKAFLKVMLDEEEGDPGS